MNVASGSFTVEFLTAFSVQSRPSLNGILANTDFTSTWQGTTLSWTLTKTTAQVVETSVTVNNSPIQDYFHPQDHAPSTHE